MKLHLPLISVLLKASFAHPPTPEPSDVPSDVPSMTPSISVAPSDSPSDVPSYTPSISVAPSDVPSDVPSYTPSISVSPSRAPSGCFSGDGLVEVLGRGEVSMRDLEIGDKVMSSNGFSQVYGFGYRDENQEMSYLKFNEALEISHNHMMLVGEHKIPMLAMDVNVGDKLTMAPLQEMAEIKSIRKVVKKGVYHPFTADGSIVVDGIIASAYSVEWTVPIVEVNGVCVMDMHTFQHMMFAPLRMMCKTSADLCKSGYDNEGTHEWDSVVEQAVSFLMNDAPEWEGSNILNVSMMTPLKVFFVCVMMMFSVFEWAVNTNMLVLLLVSVFCGMLAYFRREVKTM